MKKHDHQCASNCRECFQTFLGHKIIGLLFNALPLGRGDIARGTTTIIFDCGYGLTLSSHGTYWVESPDDIKSATDSKKIELSQVQKEIESVLALAGKGS